VRCPPRLALACKASSRRRLGEAKRGHGSAQSVGAVSAARVLPISGGGVEGEGSCGEGEGEGEDGGLLAAERVGEDCREGEGEGEE
jgi:hypothetical protein